MKHETSNVKISNFRIIEKLRYNIGVFLFVVISILFNSCSANKYSQSEIDMYLTKERVKAKTSPISFRIPQGWHIVDANNEAFIDLWIVRNDMNVSMSLLPIHSNSSSFSLKKGYESSMLLSQTKFKNNIEIEKEEPIKLNNYEVLFYNYKNGGNEYRVALFENNNKFYELTLYGDNSKINKEFFIQELMISSAK